MDALRRQVAIAYRRLLLQRFLGVLAWSWFASLLMAAIAVAVPKVIPFEINSLAWNAGWIGGAIVAGLVFAVIWTYVTRQTQLDAAIEIDRRFGLKERISSTLSLEEHELETEAGKALARDALRRVERIDVESKFGIHFSRRSLLPLIPAAAAFGLLFVADPTRDDAAQGNPDSASVTKLIKQSTEPLRKKLEERRKEAAEKGLEDAADLFKQLEQGAHELTKKDNVDRKQALSKLNDLQKQLEERREKIGGERIKEQLDNLKNLKSGPADKVADALKEGDFKKALDEIEKLQDDLAKGNLDPKKQEELKQQLADMQKKLQEAVDAQKNLEKNLEKQIADLQKQVPTPEQLKKQIEELTNQGRKEDAEKLKQQAQKMADNLDKLQQQLGKMQQQGPQMKQLQDMANKLGQCAACMGNGDKAGAAQALDSLQQDIAQMQMKTDELVMLDMALDQIAECKGDCNGEGEGMGKGNGKGKGKGKGKGDWATGAGQGEGKRDIGKDDVGFRDSHVSQNIGKGKAVITGESEGPNIKGNVRLEIQQQIEASRHEESDAVTRQRLPRSQRDHAKEYFDALREGK
jgi:tetratricopeptide (TPR) repeat protein